MDESVMIKLTRKQAKLVEKMCKEVTMKKLDITKMLTISTSHLREQTFSILAYYDFTPVVSYNYEFGTFIHIPDNLDSYDSTMPRELIKCIEFAKENNCEWLRFDRDGDIIDELQTFEW